MNGTTSTDEIKTLCFPQDFKETLEILVLEILKERPTDPLQFASNFFLEKLQSRRESRENETIEDNVLYDEQDIQKLEIQVRKSSQMSETQAATIIQAYFRGHNVRQNQWKKRFLVTHHDHLNAPLFLDSPRESFSAYFSGNEPFCFDYDSDQSIEDTKY